MAHQISSLFRTSPTPVYSFTLERVDKKTSVVKQIPRGCTAGTPVFSVHSSSSKPHLTITRAFNQRDVVATVNFHSLSSKIEVMLRGRHVQLKRKHPLTNAHSFHDPGAGELRWRESSFLSSGLVLLDSEGIELCRYKKRHGFDVLVSPDDAFLDVILVTGLAAAEYIRREDKEWDEAADSVIDVMAGG